MGCDYYVYKSLCITWKNKSQDWINLEKNPYWYCGEYDSDDDVFDYVLTKFIDNFNGENKLIYSDDWKLSSKDIIRFYQHLIKKYLPCWKISSKEKIEYYQYLIKKHYPDSTMDDVLTIKRVESARPR